MTPLSLPSIDINQRPLLAITKPVVGILGGQGALATTVFASKLTCAWAANNLIKSDTDHLPVLQWTEGLPGLSLLGLEDPPRALAILELRGTALKQLGATLFALPCNSLTPLVEPLSNVLGCEVHTPLSAWHHTNSAKKAPYYLLGSASTYANNQTQQGHAGIYLPSAETQLVVNDIISLVVKGDLLRAQALFEEVLQSRPCNQVLLACTELSCLKTFDTQVYDTLDTLVSQLLTSAIQNSQEHSAYSRESGLGGW